MPQNAQQANVAVTPAPGAHSAPLQLDVSGNLLTGNGSANKYNITAATAVKATAGRICKITVVATITGSLSVNDCATTGAVAASNTVCTIPTASCPAGTVINLDWPCTTGIVVTPGSVGTVAVSFD